MAVQSLQRLILCSLVFSSSAVQIRKHVAEQGESNAIMMFAHGCSGSSAGVDVLRKLLIAHHVNLAPTGNDELMKTLKESATEDELRSQFWTAWDQSPDENERVSSILQAKSLKEKFEILYEAAHKKNSTVVFKNELSEGHSDPDAMEYIRQVGTKVFLFLRTNLLDDLSCRVKDFCDKPENEGVGVNVDAAGKELGCEFRGRGEDEIQGMKTDTSSVRLNVDKLVETLDHQEYMDGLHSEFLKKMGFANVEIFSAEDLFAFEYGETYAPDGLAFSTSHWQKLLSNVGVEPDEATIKSVLNEYGTFPAPKNHNDLFWNVDDIEKALRGTKYHDMLRMSTQSSYLQLGQKPADEAFDNDYPARGDVVRPRMLTMEGCSGSSAIMLFARHLLRFHGIPVPSAESPHQDADGNAAPPHSYGWPDELLKENVNWFYKRADEHWGKAMEMAYEDIQHQNQTLFFKGMIEEIIDDEVWPQVKPSFQSMDILPVLGARTNMLDQVICQVNDCFHQEYGIPVEAASGERSHLCFKRRDVEGKSIAAQNEEKKAGEDDTASRVLAEHLKAYIGTDKTMLMDENLRKGNGMHFLLKGDYMAQLDTSNLIHSLEREDNAIQEARTRLEAAGFNFKQLSAEDLLDFEADPEALDRAVKAYVDLLDSFGVEPDEAVVRHYLQNFVQTYPKADKHSDLIYNFDDVKDVLRGTKYEQFIRH